MWRNKNNTTFVGSLSDTQLTTYFFPCIFMGQRFFRILEIHDVPLSLWSSVSFDFKFHSPVTIVRTKRYLNPLIDFTFSTLAHLFFVLKTVLTSFLLSFSFIRLRPTFYIQNIKSCYIRSSC